MKEDLHRVRLGDTDIPGISPESDPAAFREALEDYFRTEHPGEIEGLGQSLAEAPARPLELTREDAGALRAALERRQDESQQSSYMPLSNDWTFWMFQEDGVWSLYLVNGDGAYAALPWRIPASSRRIAGTAAPSSPGRSAPKRASTATRRTFPT